jgi:hypothetical protein
VYCTVQCYCVLYCSLFLCIVLFNVIVYCTVQCYCELYCSMFIVLVYCAVQCYCVLYCSMLLCIVLFIVLVRYTVHCSCVLYCSLFLCIAPLIVLVLPVPVAARSKALDYSRSPIAIVGSNPKGAWMFVCCVLSGRGLCDGLITRPEESYRLWCVVVCDQETS